MNLIQIEYFNSVAKHLNFTAAAKSLFVTQPSLSKQIALLEKELGVRLIYRNKRTVRLTPAGMVLYKEFENINAQIDRAIEKVKLADHGLNGTLSIGCLESINIDMFFPDLVKKFSTLYPDVEIIIERNGFRGLREKLQNESYDLIFTLSADIRNISDLKVVKVHKRRACIVMSKKNKLADKKSLKLEELSEEPFFIFSSYESPNISKNAQVLAGNHGFKNIKQVHNIDSLLSNLDLGFGFSLLDRSIGDHRKNDYKFFDLPESESLFYVVCACNKNNLNPVIHNFFKLIV